jgi:hypothetical protein
MVRRSSSAGHSLGGSQYEDTLKKDLRKCRLWLKAIDQEPEYRKNLQHRTEGTCSWIFDNGIYQEWVKSEKMHLWIKGKPG